MTKEQLIREALDWKARAEHEAKLAFADGRFLDGLIWGSKINYFGQVAEGVRKCWYETGPDVDGWADCLSKLSRKIDPVYDIFNLFENVGVYLRFEQ